MAGSRAENPSATHPPAWLGEEVAAGQLRVLEMVARGAALPDILEACVLLCESQVPGLLGSILLLDRDARTLRHGAAPSLPAEYVRAIDGSAIGEAAGSCGTAAHRAEAVYVSDISTDPLWRDYRMLALPHGLRACWSTPILDPRGAAVGTFAMYYREPGLPSQWHKDLIGMVTHLASIAIANRRADEDRRRIFERISDAFVALDAEWRYTLVNEKAGQMFGRSPESLIGKHIWTEFPEGRGQKFHLAYEQAMRELKPVCIEEYYPPYDRWFENRIFPSRDGVSIYFSDVTDRKREEEARRQSEKLAAIGQMASGVAHDFNNHLSMILGYAELLAARLSDPVLLRYAESIQVAALGSADLTRSLLDYSRRSQSESLPLDFHELIEEVVRLLDSALEKSIRVTTRLEAGRSLVIGDPATLQSALLNLALNARDAMPGGGTLEIATAVVSDADPSRFGHVPSAPDPGCEEPAPGPYLHVRVTDTGTGMTEQVRRRIFEPFFTTKPVGKGTGIGLASVFATMRAHKGRIAVESAPGKGTTFHILLPLRPRPMQRGPVPPQA